MSGALVFGSVCSGIEAASVAWKPLGWRCAFMSEIEAFPRAVLAHHHPETPLHGDFTTIKGDEYGPIDLLVGGTPCQSFSIAGLRGGMADARGNLALEFLRLADRLRPRWVVWENVPGVLSSNEGRDFGALLGGMGELGYGWAYRVLDAQFFGVAQRRRRVFVVGHFGDWRRAAAVLFEREGLSWNPAPRREAGERPARPIAGSAPAGYRNDADTAENLIAFGIDSDAIDRSGEGKNATAGERSGLGIQAEVSSALRAKRPNAVAFGGNNTSGPIDVATARTASHTASGRQDFESETFVVAHALRGEGFDASEDGTGRGVPLVVGFSNVSDGSSARNADDLSDPLTCRHGDPGMVAIAFSAKDSGGDAETDLAPTLRAGGHDKSHANAGVMPAIAFALRGREGGAMPEVHDQASALRAASGGSTRDYVAFDTTQITSPENRSNPQPGDPAGTLASAHPPAVAGGAAVRRLTPTECERLQGFPDGYTAVTYRGKAAADGPRYKALGNSMAAPVMAWIGRRIALVDAIPTT